MEKRPIIKAPLSNKDKINSLTEDFGNVVSEWNEELDKVYRIYGKGLSGLICYDFLQFDKWSFYSLLATFFIGAYLGNFYLFWGSAIVFIFLLIMKGTYCELMRKKIKKELDHISGKYESKLGGLIEQLTSQFKNKIRIDFDIPVPVNEMFVYAEDIDFIVFNNKGQRFIWSPLTDVEYVD